MFFSTIVNIFFFLMITIVNFAKHLLFFPLFHVMVNILYINLTHKVK